MLAKNTGKRIKCILACLIALAALCPARGAAADEPDIQAGSYVLIEAGTRKVLIGENAHLKLPMASTTKIMTALLAIERCSLDDLVETPAQAYGVEGSSMYLGLGETLCVRDLVYGLMLVSGNDAAVALAVHMGGSIEGFAQIMNERAKELGCLNTHFVTPNGLPNDGHYTTAYDLALISAKAMEYEAFRNIVSTEYYRTQTGSVIRTLKNKNKILWQYDGGCGIKTGYTKAAGKCLSFAAERDGMTLIGVVLNCPDMFNSAMSLLDYGFDNFEMASAVKKGQTVARVPVENGRSYALALEAEEDIIVPVRKGEKLQLKTQVDCPDRVEAPIKAGEKLGTVFVIDDGGERIAAAGLVAADDVEPKRYSDWLKTLLKRWSA